MLSSDLGLKARGLSLHPKMGDERPLDGRPTSQGCTEAGKTGKMLVSNGIRRVEICIEAVPTCAAEEKALRTTIIASNMPTTTPLLTRMAGIDFDHLHATRFCFVGEEAPQLSIAPRVHLTPILAFAARDTTTDTRQVLKHDGTARESMLNDAFAQHMVMVFSPPKPLSRKLFRCLLADLEPHVCNLRRRRKRRRSCSFQ
jgi:hypothetical protein